MEIIYFLLLFLPGIVTVLECISLFRAIGGSLTQERQENTLLLDLIGILMAIAGMGFILSTVQKDWTQVLANDDMYTPIATEHALSVYTLMILSAAAPVVLNLLNFAKKKIPPLLFVLLIAVMYIGFAEDLTLLLQVSYYRTTDGKLLLFPFGSSMIFIPYLFVVLNVLMMDIRTLVTVIRDYQTEHPEKKAYSSPFLTKMQDILFNASRWPVSALVAVLPVLGVLICLLVLFGQAPDAAIRAFTDTAEWALSQKIPPQRVYYDEHYLCTVAAGGHRKIVKPLRKGIRHGHPVVVNRQLQIANAFEQLLEERTPRFHRAVRGFYDRYGFPVSRCIRTKTAADIVYIVMKPLEWLFLVVLYLVDSAPENRIAMQYTGKSVQDVLKQEACSGEEEKKDLRA